MFNAYVNRVLTAAEVDASAMSQFTKVTGLIEPATRLLRPSMLRRAALANRRRPQRDGSRVGGPAAVVETSPI
jgi:hypothetical protein